MLIFIYRKRPKWFLVPIFFLLLIMLGYQTSISSFNEWWETNFEVIAGAATLLAAILLALSELTREWEAELPKRLTVIFTYNDLIVLKCEDAWLAGESDIRQWSQQIGRQMAGNNLEFEPYVDQKNEVVHRNGAFYKLYTATFRLNKVPDTFQNRYQKEYLNWKWLKKENNKEITYVEHAKS